MDKRTYWIWADMIGRCTRNSHPSYKNYGARGITVCDEWRSSKKFFDDMGERPEGYSLDRINNNKGYSPDNCRWATRHIQSVNRRVFKSNKFGISGIEPRGEKFRVRARHFGEIVLNKTVDDFFEACCIRKSFEANTLNQYLIEAELQSQIMKKAALQSGEVVEGAHIEQGERLEIK